MTHAPSTLPRLRLVHRETGLDSSPMRIAIACDHAAVAHKQAVIARLTALGHQVDDFGTNSADSCDYSDHGYPAARSVADGTNERGILICGTGIGMSIAANKVPGIRCALVHNLFTAEVTAAHNKPQVLAFGARIVDAELGAAMVETWLKTPFEARHQRRIDKIHAGEISAC
jgi:ribose 5-phosphate isomerase B